MRKDGPGSIGARDSVNTNFEGGFKTQMDNMKKLTNKKKEIQQKINEYFSKQEQKAETEKTRKEAYEEMKNLRDLEEKATLEEKIKKFGFD